MTASSTPWDDEPASAPWQGQTDPADRHDRDRYDAARYDTGSEEAGTHDEATYAERFGYDEPDGYDDAADGGAYYQDDKPASSGPAYDEAETYDEAAYYQHDEAGLSRRDQRTARFRQRAQAREARWQRNRLAVPYRVDGPKVTFGVIWFGLIIGTLLVAPLAVAALVAVVAGLAGLQVGFAWLPDNPATKWWTGAAAIVGAFAGFLGPIGVGAGAAFAAMLLLVHVAVTPLYDRTPPQFVDILFRSSIPVGVAAASLAALAGVELGAIVALVVLVSAYEVGDFLVGSGSANAIEGPISGLVGLAAALFILWIVAPSPFTDRSVLLFGAVAAVCCPLGQIVGSALLPRGNAWAPALRRLDSYLLSAPLWLLLLQTAPTASTL